MSRRQAGQTVTTNPLRTELETLRSQTLAVEAVTNQDAHEVVIQNHTAGLTTTEAAAASLGVEPAAWKPLGFMNTSHYDTLIKNNALSDTLARRLEAYKQVAGS